MGFVKTALMASVLLGGAALAEANVVSTTIADAAVRIGEGQSSYNFGGDYSVDVNGANESPYYGPAFVKFDGADIKQKLVAEYGEDYVITGVTFSFWADTGNNPTYFNPGTLFVAFNPNADWIEGTDFTSSNPDNPVDPNSLTGDNVASYTGSLTSLGSFAITDGGGYGNGAGVKRDYVLALEQVLVDAINSGSQFSLYLTGSDDLKMTFGGLGSSWNPASQLEVSAVPEPATLALLGLGGLLVAGRRRSA